MNQAALIRNIRAVTVTDNIRIPRIRNSFGSQDCRNTRISVIPE